MCGWKKPDIGRKKGLPKKRKEKLNLACPPFSARPRSAFLDSHTLKLQLTTSPLSCFPVPAHPSHLGLFLSFPFFKRFSFHEVIALHDCTFFELEHPKSTQWPPRRSTPPPPLLRSSRAFLSTPDSPSLVLSAVRSPTVP
jgi:hypothetical protein